MTRAARFHDERSASAADTAVAVSPAAPRARGLTLFEVIIAVALMALLMGALMTFFWQTVSIRDQARKAADRTQLVQQVLEKMTAELRDAIGMDKLGFPVTQFKGERRKITFVTAPLPPAASYAFFRETDERPLPQHDVREVTYELWIDPEKTTDEGEPLVAGILRSERRAINPAADEGVISEEEDALYLRHDLWAPEFGYLEFRYFDGVEWSTQWDVTQGNALPHLIQITIGFDSITRDDLDDKDLQTYPLEDERYRLGPDVPNPNHYSRIVRVPAADQMFASRLYRLGNEVGDVYQTNQPAPGAGEEGLDAGSPAGSGMSGAPGGQPIERRSPPAGAGGGGAPGPDRTNRGGGT